jgi:hypothetical protein
MIVFSIESLSVAIGVMGTTLDVTDATQSADIVAVLVAVRLFGVVPGVNLARIVNAPIAPAATVGVKFTVRILPIIDTPAIGAENAVLIYVILVGIVSMIVIFVQSSTPGTDPPHHQLIL